jgi:hypothetical protein
MYYCKLSRFIAVGPAFEDVGQCEQPAMRHGSVAANPGIQERLGNVKALSEFLPPEEFRCFAEQTLFGCFRHARALYQAAAK